MLKFNVSSLWRPKLETVASNFAPFKGGRTLRLHGGRSSLPAQFLQKFFHRPKISHDSKADKKQYDILKNQNNKKVIKKEI